LTLTVHVLGARGSTPATGAPFVRYGGDTSAVLLAAAGHAPDLLLDAGTGLRNLPLALGEGAPFRGAIVLGHLHWDHTHGLPFCPSLDHEDAEVDLYLPAQSCDPERLLARALGPPHFPVTPAGLRGRWRFHEIDEGTHAIGNWVVRVREIPHKGGRTFGYRVERDDACFAYLSDHHPGALGPGPDGLGERHEAALALAAGADIMFHDAQYTADEYPARAAYGHSAIGYAVDLGRMAGVRRTGLFHHDPSRTDDALDKIAAAFDHRVLVVAQGQALDV
jgi:ribonuclease BN (tRNA processing enzyme)